jgi:hypothetical protein
MGHHGIRLICGLFDDAGGGLDEVLALADGGWFRLLFGWFLGFALAFVFASHAVSLLRLGRSRQLFGLQTELRLAFLEDSATRRFLDITSGELCLIEEPGPKGPFAPGVFRGLKPPASTENRNRNCSANHDLFKGDGNDRD